MPRKRSSSCDRLPVESLSAASATLRQRAAVREVLGPEDASQESVLWAESCGEPARYRAMCVRACMRAMSGGDHQPRAAECSESVTASSKVKDALQDVLRRRVDIGLVVCRNCKSRDVSIEARQTRSADEGMTMFMECNACRARWRA